ncbi:MAG TPA: pantetheine-phosphate adenylyltransferase [Clostridia bacterium]|jgi:pantetheine-phosphate adenylyltransferase|nr:pantetheine-phosphate adenylyltransferase [Clostridia bacterium]
MRIAVYPGSFDPVTNGHVDIIRRASTIFDEVIVTIAYNQNKKPLFTVDERVELLKAITADIPNVKVMSYSGLLVNLVEELNAKFIVRGLRAISDFELEFQLALMNKKLNHSIETVFLITKCEYSYVSSSLVKEVASLGGCIDDLVPELVKFKLQEKFKKLNEGGI